MSANDAEWIRRHIAFFRNQRGHSACTVEGCIGSQPPMWVPTEAEVKAEQIPRGRAIDMPSPLHPLAQPHWPRRPDHIHWALP